VHGGFRYTAGIGRFEDGRLAGNLPERLGEGGNLDRDGGAAAIVASIALENGATAETIRHALTRNSDGTVGGPLGRLVNLLAAPR
jgi:hypothetical protein